ncbi:response regulator transcription factor [bacterium]|nr:response regulator transcription factor [bacterium]
MRDRVENALVQLREKVYSLLSVVSSPPSENIVAKQNMDLQLSPGLRKGGVNIFQFQNAVIDNKVVNVVVEILRDIDRLRDIVPIESSIDSYFDSLIEEGVTWREFVKRMQREFIQAYLRKGLTITEIARRLGIQRTYLSRVLTELGLRDDIQLIRRR